MRIPAAAPFLRAAFSWRRRSSSAFSSSSDIAFFPSTSFCHEAPRLSAGHSTRLSLFLKSIRTSSRRFSLGGAQDNAVAYRSENAPNAEIFPARQSLCYSLPKQENHSIGCLPVFEQDEKSNPPSRIPFCSSSSSEPTSWLIACNQYFKYFSPNSFPHIFSKSNTNTPNALGLYISSCWLFIADFMNPFK